MTRPHVRGWTDLGAQVSRRVTFSAMKAYVLGGWVTRNGTRLPAVLLGVFWDNASAQRAADWIAELTGQPSVGDWQHLDDDRIVRSWSTGDMGVSLGIQSRDIQVPKPSTPSKPPSTRNVAPSPPKRKDGKQLYIVQSGRSSTLHLMRSRTPSTPNPMSPGSIAAQLLWFGGNAKRTLCGRQATRAVSDVFQANEVTCRECKRRAGFG
jgi:hypothetical protein